MWHNYTPLSLPHAWCADVTILRKKMKKGAAANDIKDDALFIFQNWIIEDRMSAIIHK